MRTSPGGVGVGRGDAVSDTCRSLFGAAPGNPQGMPDPKDRSDEMEQDLHELEDHIEDAEKGLERSKAQAGALDDVAGEPSGPQEASGGEDPSGADDEDDPDGREPAEVASPT